MIFVLRNWALGGLLALVYLEATGITPGRLAGILCGINLVFVVHYLFVVVSEKK